jgi:hypothetical protein
MKKPAGLFARSVLLLIPLAIISQNSYGQSVSIWGNVLWATGSPAIGVEVKLVRNDKTLSVAAYTNQAGRYAFFGIKGKPADYTLMVYYRDKLLRQEAVHDLRNRNQVPDIIISSR